MGRFFSHVEADWPPYLPPYMGRSQLKPPLENLRYASTRAEHVLLPTPQTDFFSVSLSLSLSLVCVRVCIGGVYSTPLAVTTS